MPAHDTHHRRFHGAVVLLAGHFLDHIGAQVGGHHDHRVAEIHGAALAVGQATIFQHLQQDVEHVRVGLLHFIQQQQRVGAAAHRLGQVAAFLVADVAGGRTDHPCHGVLLHELRHVHPHHGLLAVKQELRQRLAQLGLAHPGRAEEEEGTVGAVGVGEAGPAAAHRVGDRLHRLVLAHHPLVQGGFHAQQLVAVAL